MNANELSSLLKRLDVERSSDVDWMDRPFDDNLLDEVESSPPINRCGSCGVENRTPLLDRTETVDKSVVPPCLSCGERRDKGATAYWAKDVNSAKGEWSLQCFAESGESDYDKPEQCDQPRRVADHSEAIALVWDWLEKHLSNDDESLQEKSQSAFLSDVALAVCEASEAEMMKLLDCMEAGRLTGKWKYRIGNIRFQRLVKSYDIGEVQTKGAMSKILAATVEQCSAFWDEVPQHETTAKDLDDKSHVFQEVLARWSSVGDDESLLSSIIAICEVPDFSGREQAKSACMSKSSHYRNLEKLRTRLSCFGLIQTQASC